jgi:hypothetical protein
MNNFIPEVPKEAQDVPYFDDVSKDAGWQGHTTSKSIETLKSEIITSIGRLGGIVTGFQKGRFNTDSRDRGGFRLLYAIEAPNGNMFPGRIDIAALPVKNDHRHQRSYETRIQQSLKMALYMFKMALDGAWFLQQLSPGYSALMPWMLGKDQKTISQLWGESAIMRNLLPPAESVFEQLNGQKQ